MAPRNLIYGLRDPRSGEIRYVGQTAQGLRRPTQHWTPSTLKQETNTHKRRWLRSLLACGLEPEVVILERVRCKTRLARRERAWISCLRAEGVRLTNVTDGGVQPRGYRWSSQGKINQSWAQRQRFADPREGARHSEKLRKLWAAPEFRRKMVRARRNQFTEEVRVKIARTLGGRVIRDQHGVIYATLAEAARRLGVRRSGIQLVLRGIYAQTGGYVFHYVD